jgi:hypothetical protein
MQNRGLLEPWSAALEPVTVARDTGSWEEDKRGWRIASDCRSDLATTANMYAKQSKEE